MLERYQPRTARLTSQLKCVVIHAETHERINVLPDRKSETLEAWMRNHSGTETVRRDGSASYAKAIRRALPEATQVSD
ncbi:transposase IS204/IS1001/IS1096/IS1165 family protein [Actinobacteria bacterium OK006]|nr:transposase IS204/IS1001/IS1096/IS1165 family protein [Actinobacteria bacterium OK006]